MATVMNESGPPLITNFNHVFYLMSTDLWTPKQPKPIHVAYLRVKPSNDYRVTYVELVSTTCMHGDYVKHHNLKFSVFA